MKKLLFALSLFALAISPAAARAQDGHEYSPMAESTVNYKTWALPSITTARNEDLRKLMTGKKLVMVVYFAPWCKNWRMEAPVAAKLYDKYKAQGFQVIGVSEYGIKRRQREDASLRVPAAHRRQAQLGFAVEHLSRTREDQRRRRRARRESLG